MLNVVKLDNTNLMDIPAMLRKLADEIEQKPETAEHAIVVLAREDGSVEARGYGKVGDRAHEVGVLEFAKLQLMI